MPNWRHWSLESFGKTMPAFFAEPTALSAQALEVRLEPMTEAHLDAVRALEHSAYAHPWQHRHFADCLASGYQAQMLMAGEQLLGYFVAMKGFEEVHLLNISVAPAHQGQGWGGARRQRAGDSRLQSARFSHRGHAPPVLPGTPRRARRCGGDESETRVAGLSRKSPHEP
jgi:hypothetical protein